MKNLKRKVNPIITLAALLAIFIGCFGAYNLQAAERVDTTKSIRITAAIAEQDSSRFATDFTGVETINLYKIAVMDETGQLSLADQFKDSGIDLSVIQSTSSVEQVIEAVVNPAKNVAETLAPTDVIAFDRADKATSASVDIERGAGIYLYIPEDAQDSRYKYEFTSYILFAPTSDFIATGSGSDEWSYESRFNLKSTEEDRLGSLEIKKTLDTFNSSLGEAAFVYKVKAARDEKVVLDNVYTINFDRAGSISRVIEEIPADAEVTVTEVYKGSSYNIVGDSTKTTTIVADETVAVEFENDYDGRLISGGISAENNFEEEDGVIYWIDEDGTRVRQ